MRSLKRDALMRYETVEIDLDEEVHAKLVNLARENRISIDHLISDLLWKFITELEKESLTGEE